jgi:hypothetical protein
MRNINKMKLLIKVIVDSVNNYNIKSKKNIWNNLNFINYKLIIFIVNVKRRHCLWWWYSHLYYSYYIDYGNFESYYPTGRDEDNNIVKKNKQVLKTFE